MSTRIFENYYNTINVKDYGAKGDGVTDDAAAINAAIISAENKKYGIVKLNSGNYRISSPIILRKNIFLVGSGVGSTTITLANNSNCNVIESQNFAALTNTNAYAPANPDVPYWFGIRDFRIDCNGANQTTGNGIAFYGNAYSIQGQIVVENAFQDAVYTEGPAAATLTSWLGQEEGFFDGTILAIKPGRYGWLFRGPHNSRIGEFRCILKDNGDYGFKSETTANYSAVLDHFDIIHVYGEATNITNRKGIYIGGITKGNLIQGDSTGVVFENVAAGKAKSQINTVRVTGVGKGIGNEIGLKVDEAEVFIKTVEAATSASADGATCVQWNGAYGGITQLYMTDDSAKCNGLRVNAGNTSFDNINISGFLGTNSIGVDINATAVHIRGLISNCKQCLYYRSGSRLNAVLDIFTATGQLPFSGQTPNGGTDKIILTATGAVVSNNPARILGPTIDLTSTALQTITVPHTSIWTPPTNRVLYSFRSATSGLKWETPLTLKTIDATNMYFECKLATAATGLGYITAHIDV